MMTSVSGGWEVEAGEQSRLQSRTAEDHPGVRRNVIDQVVRDLSRDGVDREVGRTLIFTLDAAAERIPPEDKSRIARDWSQTYEIPPEEVPDVEPILYRIAEAGNGRIVVFPRLAGAPRGTIADVFQRGTFEGRIALPRQLEVLHHQPVFSVEFLIGVVKGESGNGSVVGLRIPDWPPMRRSARDR